MTVVELDLDEETEAQARAAAAKRGYTLEEHLTRNAVELAKCVAVEDRKKMVERLLEISKRANARVGPITWSREDIYDR